MGVFATSSVGEGVTFGPIPAALTLTDPAVLIGHMTCDVRPNIHTVKVDIQDYREGSQLFEWTPYVQAARNKQEQTLEAFVRQSHLYYRTTRIIRPGDELLVWYSNDYARMLDIPELQSCHMKENGEFCCPACSQTYRFPHSLRAHIRFKCKQRPLVLSKPPADRVGFVPQGEPPAAASQDKRQLESSECSGAKPKRAMMCTVNSNVHQSVEEGMEQEEQVEQTDEGCGGGSAFTKVEKTPRPPPPSNQSTFLQSLINKAGMGPDEKASMAALVSIYNRHPIGLLACTNIHNIENTNPHYKLAASGIGSNILPYYHSQNPMVEKLIQSALQVAPSNVNLNQNWCAKCNASFRMTSDLVYHMRSHHTPIRDIGKKKRDEKLKCNFCGETFRERHHLTRHMTSHQDM